PNSTVDCCKAQSEISTKFAGGPALQVRLDCLPGYFFTHTNSTAKTNCRCPGGLLNFFPSARPASSQLPSDMNSADQATSLPCCGKGSTGPISNSANRM